LQNSLAEATKGRHEVDKEYTSLSKSHETLREKHAETEQTVALLETELYNLKHEHEKLLNCSEDQARKTNEITGLNSSLLEKNAALNKKLEDRESLIKN